MFCSQCGKPNPVEARFCSVCGRAMSASGAPPAVVSAVPVAATQSRLTLEKHKPGCLGMLSVAFGLFYCLLAILLGFTILGLPIAFLMFIGASAFIAMGMGGSKFKCPHCGRELVARPGAESHKCHKCHKCKNRTLIDWKESGKTRAA